MKAVVYRGVGDVALETVPEPKPQQPTHAIVRITARGGVATSCRAEEAQSGVRRRLAELREGDRRYNWLHGLPRQLPYRSFPGSSGE